MNLEDLQEVAITRLNEDLEDYGCEMVNAHSLIPKDSEELHDFLLSGVIEDTIIEEDDKLYDELCDLLSNDSVVNSIINLMETEYDLMSYDPWREHCDKDFYGV